MLNIWLWITLVKNKFENQVHYDDVFCLLLYKAAPARGCVVRPPLCCVEELPLQARGLQTSMPLLLFLGIILCSFSGYLLNSYHEANIKW